MKRPVVGVIGNAHRIENRFNVQGVGERSMRAVAEVADALPLMFASAADITDIGGLLDVVDGVMLTGARANVHPTRFRTDPHPKHEPYDESRDALALALVEACVARSIPIFGICRGLQEMNVAYGGTLHPEIRELPGRINHRMPRLPTGEIHPDPAVVFADRHEVRLVSGGVVRRAARPRDHPRQLPARPGHSRARRAHRGGGRGGRRHHRGHSHCRSPRLCARRAMACRARPAAQCGQPRLVRGIRPGAAGAQAGLTRGTSYPAIGVATNTGICRSVLAFATQQPLPGASPDAAVAAAARGVLVPLLQELPAPFSGCAPASVTGVEDDYAAALAAIPDGRAKQQGVQLGRAAAALILALRTGDGSDTTLFDTAYRQGTARGAYRFTPGFDFVFAPGWADVTPFVLSDSSQFRADPPYDVTSRRYAADFAEVKRLGGDDVTTPSERTTEQTEIALFWVESSPLQWNRIARTVAARLDPWKQARLFGLLNMALADGYVGSFETKYLYNYWRPVTAIHQAAGDGNRNTSADPTWTPLVPTPPIPDHDSAHSVEGGAAAEVLRRFFGTDRIAFRTCSLTLASGSTCTDRAPVTRRYRSFSEAAEENGRSRILVGFHFRNAVEDGIEHGRRIGGRAVDRFLRPAR